jgi:CRISPR-associated protein Cas1
MTAIAATPDYLPARMLNEYVYCPRLFYYEWVEGVFIDNRETVEGALRHQKLERKEDSLPDAEQVAAGETIHSRSVTLSSDTHLLIAKLDLIEGANGIVTPVDYKRGAPREAGRDGALTAWDADRVQLAAQALILRDNGYHCDEGVIYYVATKQRVRVPIDEETVRWTLEQLQNARAASVARQIPPPLEDSPKCPRCSLVAICLPDETWSCSNRRRVTKAAVQRTLFDDGRVDVGLIDGGAAESEVRRLLPARDDLRPLYLNTQGLRVGKSGAVLMIQEKEKVIQEVRLGEICQLNLMGNIQLTTQAVQALCEEEIPIAYFSMGGWFYGVTHGLGVKNIYLRREQFRLADVPGFCLRLARELVAGKIRNQRTLLQRNHIEPPASALAQMKCMMDDSEQAESLDELLGIEGNAARVYFQHFSGMIKLDDSLDHAADEPVAAESAKSPGTDRPTNETTKARPKNNSSTAPSLTPTHELAEGVLARPKNNSSTAPSPLAGEGRVRGSKSGSCFSAEPRPSASDVFTFDFLHRNRRPPRDPINALLSLAYSVLAKDLTIVCHAVGFDPFLGFYHQPRFGRAALALDLMEPFRPLIADSAVLTAINTRMVTLRDFIRTGPAVALKPDGRKAFFRAYEQRMDTLVTHPLFGYRVNYRRVLEIQARLLARVLTGEIGTYPVFTTR